MADNRNFAALDWLIHEISDTLQEARQALEAYVENPEEAAQLRSCLSFIHQVHGSLQMTGFFGAAMLADEMERVTHAIIQNTTTNSGEAQEVLMRGILQFPHYLEQVKLSRNDNPFIILPMLNDLRAVRGESLLNNTKLFVPNLAPSRKINGNRSAATHDNVQFQAMALKLRQMFQYAAAGFIRAVSAEENLSYLQKVFVRLQKLTQGTARQPLWDICLALVEALETNVLEMSASLKNLLRQLDKEIKILAVYGIKSLNSYTDDDVIKNLLYYVARAGKNTPAFKEDSQLQRIYELYHLSEALIEGSAASSHHNMLSAPDAEAMRSVAEALKTELEMVKAALDECISDEYGQQKLSEVAPVVKRIADTMAVLGLGDLRKTVLAQGSILEVMASSKNPVSHEQLIAAASNIIAIENELDSLVQKQVQSSQHKVDEPSENDITLTRAKESVLRESRSGLERIKNAIVEYIASQWDRKHLEGVPATLREIRGGLGIIPLPDAARIIDACARYIEEELLTQEFTPQWSKLDSLADAIASVEYYLERLSAGSTQEENEVLLTVAEESIALLGYGVVSPHRTSVADNTLVSNEQHISEQGQAAASVSAEEEAHLTAAYHSVLQTESLEDASTTEDISDPLATITIQAQENDADNIPILQHLAIEPYPEIQPQSQDIIEPVTAPAPEVKTFAPLTSDDSDGDEIDEEIIEIFVEEAGEVLQAINEFFPLWAQNFEDTKSLIEFRRAFHTLKGSGRMVAAHDIAKVAWAVEGMLNRVLDHTVEPRQFHVAIIEKVCAILPAMIAAFSQHQPNPHPDLTEKYSAMADSMAQGIVPEELAAAYYSTEKETKHTPDLVVQRVVAEPHPSSNDQDISYGVQTDHYNTESESQNNKDKNYTDDDEQLWDIFAGEALIHLQVVEEFIAHMDAEAPCYEALSEEVQRALHTLKGSAYMAAVTSIAELIAPLEKFAKELRSYQVIVTDEILHLLRDAVIYTHAGLQKIAQRDSVDIPELEQFIARVNDLHHTYIEPLVYQHAIEGGSTQSVDPKILAMFMTEELSALLDADRVIAHWKQNASDVIILQPLLNEVRQLTHGARIAGLPLLATLSESMEYLYEHLLAQHLPCSDSLCESLDKAHIALLDMMDTIAAGQNLISAPADIEAKLQEWIVQADANETSQQYETASEARESETDIISHAVNEETKSQPVDEPLLLDSGEANAMVDAENDIIKDDDESQAITETIEDVNESIESVVADIQPSHALQTHEEKTQEEPAPINESVVQDEDFDPEIIEIFIEEAVELLEDIERSLHNWQEDISDPQPVEELKRYLHTFKGGARLAGLTELGDLSHNFESVLIDMDDSTDINQALFVKLNDYQDRLHKGVEEIRVQLVADYAAEEAAYETQRKAKAEKQNDNLPATLSADSATQMAGVLVDDSYSSIIDFNSIGQKPNVLTFAPKAKPPAAPVPKVPGSEFGGLRQTNDGPTSTQHLASRRTGPQEVVKVPAELLEELVNLAGETSISRGRMQQQVMDMGGAIGEMDSTIKRLQEQLRRLDIETEAQVAFRQEKMLQHEEFDPLEMDRYSQLQQLSRSLMESASDLMDLKYTLSDKTRDAETLLLQQSRINTDLQEGLMRSRMVPFSRLVPRLRRIVRQAAVELNKEVNFELDNVEGELDRTVLERMVAPLEHMLRNAVDHGIESFDDRVAAGKSAMGRITLSLSREGGDVILRLSDDGRGINLQRVREKAIERGLISEDARLSDQDLIQFILHAGFSTADKVTQISGRGVGMDVVHAEIKQLGGAMFIDSRWGEGTTFIIRLPFTVSVNRALMVQMGDDLYAIPLNTIEGIVRVSPFELEHYYQDESARFEYAGENYLVRYLGAMLESGANPKLEGQVLPIPVVLVRSAEVTVALQVDRLLGSREIVVKTLGAQFSAVQGLSGATVMGDGSVVVILDLHALIRQQLALGIGNSVLLEPHKFQPVIEEESTEKFIMVVDDSVTVRKVTTRFLEREGYSVVTAKDGVEALQLLQDKIPDVMLLDIEMPRMDGFEVAKNIRTSSRMKNIPIIMITSRTGDKHRERAFDLGVNKYMGKPYQEDVLLANIQELMATPVN